MKTKIAIIIPRFTVESSGGAERHALEFAKLLSDDYDVTVLTTTAKDYQTWENYFPIGEQIIDNYKIIRFANVQKKNLKEFSKLSKKLIDKLPNISIEQTKKWIIDQGPYCPDLVSYIESNIDTFDVFFFITYLYYPIVYGIPKVKSKSICLLTLHEEIYLQFPIFKNTFTEEIKYCFNTSEELDLFFRTFGYKPFHYSVIGMNISLPKFEMTKELDFPYILFIGRVEYGKGLNELFEYFVHWKKVHPSNIKLLVIGSGKIDCSHPDIVFTGFVSEYQKYSYIYNSLFLVNSSQLESFSIVIMEAWLLGKAVLVNGNSTVLQMHCERSQGGLYYWSLSSFVNGMNYLIDHIKQRDKLGQNGKSYVLTNYNSQIVKSKLKNLIDYH